VSHTKQTARNVNHRQQEGEPGFDDLLAQDLVNERHRNRPFADR
jgi:hypothetical protein